MGVTWTLRVLAPPETPDAAIGSAVAGALAKVVAEMSPWEPESDISRFNHAEAGSWVAAPLGLLEVVSAALAVAEASDGAFDPTLGRVVDLWGFGPAGAVAAPPQREALEAACAGWRDLRADLASGRLLQPGGLSLDLSGIAKGYGVDQAAQALKGLGLRDFLLDVGGELRGSGVKGDGQPWWVEVERPPDARFDAPPLLVALHGLSIATSGDWRRTYSAGGRSYSHTIDPRSRRPVERGPAAATVLHEACMHADAWCTALMAAGEDAKALARNHDLAACIVSRGPSGGEEWVSPALERMLA